MYLHIQYLHMQIHIDESDEIDRVRRQWRSECAGLDTTPMETIGRILRVQFLAGLKMRRVFQRHGIDSGGFDVLATLRRSGAPHRLTPTHLYKGLVLTSGAMTHRLDALEKAGLVERQPDPEDRRGSLICLTRNGRTLVDRAMKAHLEVEATIAVQLSEAEQKTLAKLLKKLLLIMENEHESK
jgi:DNA-binding MarR family transcriptional regulator